MLLWRRIVLCNYYNTIATVSDLPAVHVLEPKIKNLVWILVILSQASILHNNKHCYFFYMKNMYDSPCSVFTFVKQIFENLIWKKGW